MVCMPTECTDNALTVERTLYDPALLSVSHGALPTKSMAAAAAAGEAAESLRSVRSVTPPGFSCRSRW